MKKKSTLFILLTALLLVGTANAETHRLANDVKLVKREAKKVELKVNQPAVGKLDVKIYDSNRSVVYEGTINDPAGPRTAFDLGKLAQGEYTVDCSNTIFWSSQKMKINADNSIEIIEESYQEVQKPLINELPNNRFQIIAQQQNIENLSVTIFDYNGVPMYQGSLGKINRFNLSKLLPGEYTFEFSFANSYMRQAVIVK